jgi:hypothetical protein
MANTSLLEAVLNAGLCGIFEADSNRAGQEMINEGSVDTNVQETFTCMVFDAYFNGPLRDTALGRGNNILKSRGTLLALAEYMTSPAAESIYSSLGSQYSKTAHMLFDMEPLPEDEKKRARIIKKMSDPEMPVNGEPTHYWVTTSPSESPWRMSYLYQLEGFIRFVLSRGYSDKNIAFIQHNTKNCFCGGLSPNANNAAVLVDRVEKGRALFGISKKDLYQKADIYAVWSFTGSSDPIEPMIDEIAFWSEGCASINKLTSTRDRFVGISLKELVHRVSNIDPFNEIEDVEKARAKGVTLQMTPFKNISFRGFRPGDSSNIRVTVPDKNGSSVTLEFANSDDLKIGSDNLTAYMKYSLQWNKHTYDKVLTMRSGNLGDAHINSFGKVGGQYKHGPRDFFKPTMAAMMSTVGELSFDGRAKDELNALRIKHNIPADIEKRGKGDYSAPISMEALEVLFDSVMNNCRGGDARIQVDANTPTEIPGEVKDMIRYITDGTKISEILCWFEYYEERRKAGEDISKEEEAAVLQHAKALKWLGIFANQLDTIKVILSFAEVIQAEQERNGNPVTMKRALQMVFVELIFSAKGIGDNCLPYLFLL